MTSTTPPGADAPEVDVEALAALHEQAFVLDVRAPSEYVAGHIPGAVLIPLGELTGRSGRRVVTDPAPA